jgi:hypothetical protein
MELGDEVRAFLEPGAGPAVEVDDDLVAGRNPRGALGRQGEGEEEGQGSAGGHARLYYLAAREAIMDVIDLR